MAGRTKDEAEPNFLLGGGQTGALMRSFDWASTSLGPPAQWPYALKTAVSLMLGARQPVYIAWGPDLISMYNDGYLPIVGTKHPHGFGKPFAELWIEIWEDFRPIVEATMSGNAQHFVDLPIALAGRPDLPVGYFTFSYTALRDDAGQIAGFYCAATETTDKVLAERHQGLERERQRQMLRQMPGFVALLGGREHRYEYVNDAYISISGPRDFLGRTVRDVFPELEGQGFYELLDQVFTTGERFAAREIPVRLSQDGGDERFIDLVYEPIRDDGGVVTGIFVGGYDITERVRAERALRESEERYRTLFENTDAAFCVVEVIFDETGQPVDHRFVETNPAFERQSGLQNALGRTAREILPDHEQHWFDTYGRIVRTGEPARFENGSDALGRWFDVHAMRIGRPDEHRVAILFNDISQRKKSEDGLRQQNEALEGRVATAIAERRVLADVVEGTDAFVQVADKDYRWLAINRAAADEFERIYGVRPAVGNSMLDLLADRPEHRDAVKRVWGRALSGEVFTEVGEFGDPGRDRRSYEMKYNTLRDANGRMIGAYQFVYDVTDRVREQRRLADAEEALRQSQKMEIVGQLTGGVAHDFNNLLMAILSNLDLLRKRAPNDPGLMRLIDGAAQGANRGAALTQRLLAFARRQTLTLEPADIGALVEGMRELLLRSLGSGIELHFGIRKGLPLALVDPNQVELALLNLVINARDAMPNGGTITIEADVVRYGAQADLTAGEYVRLCVTDTGIGMDAATLERAIEPFFSTKELGKGTGLGLSMIHGLAKQLNGALRLTSKLGEGVRAELFLPVTALQIPATSAAASSIERAVARRSRILVVDDDALILMSTAEMLSDLGHDVIEANSGDQALTILKTEPGIDLILTDFSMPRMNGGQLAEKARELLPSIPVLLATGYAETPKGLGSELPRLGKPYSQAQLAAEIGRLLAPTSSQFA